MPGNKRIRRSSDRTAKSLAKETPILSASDLKREVHRLEVAIAAVPREMRGSSNMLPPPESMRRGRSGGSAARLTYAQAQKRRQQLWLGFAQFVVSAVLLAGATAWIYKLWMKSH